MHRISFALIAATLVASALHAQNIVPVHHRGSAESEGCADGQCASCRDHTCGKCNDCLRIPDVKKTQVPVYSCKVKEICIPHRSLLALLGCAEPSCQKIEVRQLVKKYRTEEKCVSICVTPEELAKRQEAESKKQKQATPPAPVPSKLPSTTMTNEVVVPSTGVHLIGISFDAGRKE